MTQPQQNPYQPQAPEPKKNWFLRHKILTGLLALIAVVVVINLATNGSESTDDATAAPPTSAAGAPAASASAEPAEPAGPGIGSPVRDGKFEFVVQTVQPGVASVGDQYTSQTPQGEYVLVTLSVSNIGDRQQLFDTTSQKLLDAAGRQYSTDTLATVTNDPNIGFAQINPGNSVVSTLVFDVPVGTAPNEIELHDSVFSGGATVSLL